MSRQRVGGGDSQTPFDELEFLVQSTVRFDVLAQLCQEPGLDRDNLEGRLDVSRRTVIRTLNKLEERGYLVDGSDGCEVTTLGERVHKLIDEVTTDVAFEDDLSKFFANLPQGTFDFDLDHLSGADVVIESDADPFAPLDHILQARRRASRIREFAPAIERRSVQQLAERIENGEELDIDLIIPEAVLATAESTPQYSDAHQTVTESPAVDLYVYSGSVSVVVAILDETSVCVTATGSDRAMLLESSDPAVVEWAGEWFERHRAESTPLAE